MITGAERQPKVPSSDMKLSSPMSKHTNPIIYTDVFPVKNWLYSENMFGVVFDLGGPQRITVEVVDLEGDIGDLQVKDVRKGLNRSQL